VYRGLLTFLNIFKPKTSKSNRKLNSQRGLTNNRPNTYYLYSYQEQLFRENTIIDFVKAKNKNPQKCYIIYVTEAITYNYSINLCNNL